MTFRPISEAARSWSCDNRSCLCVCAESTRVTRYQCWMSRCCTLAMPRHSLSAIRLFTCCTCSTRDSSWMTLYYWHLPPAAAAAGQVIIRMNLCSATYIHWQCVTAHICLLHAAIAAIDQCLSVPAWAHSSKPAAVGMQCSHVGTDRRMDTVPFHRPCSAYCVGCANNNNISPAP